MATSLQLSPNNQQFDVPNPVSLYPGRKGGISAGGIPGAVGRAFGSAALTTGPDGQLRPEHHILDALLNRGGAANAALQINQQKAQQATQQSRQLQLMKADTENQISMGNNVEANQAKLAQVNSAIAINQAQVAQGLGQATKAGVVAAPPVNPTPGMSLLASDVSRQNALNTGSQAIQTGQVLGSQPYADSLAKGMSAENLAPEYANDAKIGLNVAGVGGVQPTPNGTEAVVAPPRSSSSTSQPYLIKRPDGSSIPMGTVQTGSSTEPSPSVTIPTDPDKLAQVTAGMGEVQDNQIPGTNISDEETSGPVSPTPSDSQTSKDSAKSAAFVQQPFVQSQAGIQTSPTNLLQSIVSDPSQLPGAVSPTPDNQQSALQRFRNYLLMNPGMYR